MNREKGLKLLSKLVMTVRGRTLLRERLAIVLARRLEYNGLEFQKNLECIIKESCQRVAEEDERAALLLRGVWDEALAEALKLISQKSRKPRLTASDILMLRKMKVTL